MKFLTVHSAPNVISIDALGVEEGGEWVLITEPVE